MRDSRKGFGEILVERLKQHMLQRCCWSLCVWTGAGVGGSMSTWKLNKTRWETFLISFFSLFFLMCPFPFAGAIQPIAHISSSIPPAYLNSSLKIAIDSFEWMKRFMTLYMRTANYSASLFRNFFPPMLRQIWFSLIIKLLLNYFYGEIENFYGHEGEWSRERERRKVWVRLPCLSLYDAYIRHYSWWVLMGVGGRLLIGSSKKKDDFNYIETGVITWVGDNVMMKSFSALNLILIIESCFIALLRDGNRAARRERSERVRWLREKDQFVELLNLRSGRRREDGIVWRRLHEWMAANELHHYLAIFIKLPGREKNVYSRAEATSEWRSH